jgi:hypothetical protein
MKNAWYMVAYRQFNQWCRRVFIIYCGWMVGDWVKGLRAERCWISCRGREKMTELDWERGRRINWLLGEGSPYKFTPEERAAQDRLATEILEEITNESH